MRINKAIQILQRRRQHLSLSGGSYDVMEREAIDKVLSVYLDLKNENTLYRQLLKIQEDFDEDLGEID